MHPKTRTPMAAAPTVPPTVAPSTPEQPNIQSRVVHSIVSGTAGIVRGQFCLVLAVRYYNGRATVPKINVTLLRC